MDAAAMWKTPEALTRAAVRDGLELATKAAAAFFHNRLENAPRLPQRPQAPPDIYTRKNHSFGIRKGGIDLVEAMQNALPGFEER